MMHTYKQFKHIQMKIKTLKRDRAKKSIYSNSAILSLHTLFKPRSTSSSPSESTKPLLLTDRKETLTRV